MVTTGERLYNKESKANVQTVKLSKDYLHLNDDTGNLA